ncbi:MAG: outer membrane protein assembly factor BamB [Verrucomicrobiales bacterium]|jgi:outer membrane protein assembly factor BamB
MRITIQASALLIVIAVGSAFADNWPQWRGPDGQGHAPPDAKTPKEWSETKNMVWKTDLTGRGWSSPVIADGMAWMTAAHETEADPAETKRRLEANTGGQEVTVLASVRLQAIGVDLESGEIKHDFELFTVKQPQWVHRFNSYASPTPWIEGGKLYCHFGGLGTACVHTASAKVLWTNTDPDLTVMHENGPGGSPVLFGKSLIFHLDGSDRQFIAALNAETGKVKWKTERSGKLHDNPQLKKAYGTPLLAKIDGKHQVLSQGANWLYSYDPESGEELWRLSYERLGFSNVARAVLKGDRLFMATGFMQSEMFAVDLPTGSSEPSIAWKYTKGVPKSPSPILVGDELYFVSDSGGTLTCLDAESGDQLYRERISGGKYWSAPTYANGHLYFHNEEGVTTVLKAGTEFEVVAENKLDGRHFASAAVFGNDLILRTDKALYRIGKK